MGASDIRSQNYREIRLDVGESFADARIWEPREDVLRSGAGVIFVSGVDGGFVEPADGVYDLLAHNFAAGGVPSIFVAYRFAGELEPSIADASAAAEWLRRRGVHRIAIVGWSFGGAVILNAATRLPGIISIVGFSPQARDTEPVAWLRPGQSILLFHSLADENVPYEASTMILEDAPPGSRIKLVSLSDADHQLTGMGPVVAPLAWKWLSRDLNPGPCTPPELKR